MQVGTGDGGDGYGELAGVADALGGGDQQLGNQHPRGRLGRLARLAGDLDRTGRHHPPGAGGAVEEPVQRLFDRELAADAAAREAFAGSSSDQGDVGLLGEVEQCFGIALRIDVEPDPRRRFSLPTKARSENAR